MKNEKILESLEILPKTITEYLRENYDAIHKILELYRTRNKKSIKELSKKNPLIFETPYETIINLMRLDGVVGYNFSMESVRTMMSRIKKEKENKNEK